jgi:hypothetical protein
MPCCTCLRLPGGELSTSAGRMRRVGGRQVDGDCEWDEAPWQTEARAHQRIFASKSRVCLTCLLSLFCSHAQRISYFRPRADLQSPSETCHVLLQESPRPVNSMPMRNCGGTRGHMLPFDPRRSKSGAMLSSVQLLCMMPDARRTPWLRDRSEAWTWALKTHVLNYQKVIQVQCISC